MPTEYKNKLALVFIFVYTLIHFGWISLGQTFPYILGGNIFSISGVLIATFWLAGASRKANPDHRLFWRLLALGTFSYATADALKLIYENMFTTDVPYPGSPDIFYILTLIFYLIAIGYKLNSEKKHLSLVKFTFDIFLVMTVYITFYWYFLIQPLFENSLISSTEFTFSLIYPLGDLALLFFIILLFFNGRRIFHRYTTVFLLAGVLLQITADIGFLFLENTGSNVSGRWLDPLYVLGILLIGYTGLLQNESLPSGTNDLLVDEGSGSFRMVFPYIYVSTLFIFMIINASTFNEVTIGAGITIAVIIVRQLIVLIENKRLIKKYAAQATDLILSEERYKSLFAHHPDAVFSLDLKGHVLSVNKKGEDLLGVKREKLISRSILHFVDEEHKEKVSENFYNTKNGVSQHYEFTITNSFGRFLYINVTHIPIMVKKELVGVFAIAQDVTQNKLNEQRIHHLAYHDPLTNLANRAHFEEHLADQIKRSEKNHDPFAVLFLDLNNFKSINDTHGHACGDELLSQIGQRILSCLKETDHAARLGGDEFTLLLTDICTPEDISKQIRYLLEKLSDPYLIKGKILKSIPSIGFSLYPEDGLTAQTLLSKADDAMYANKRRSKQ